MRITACLVTLASLVPMMVVQLAGVGQLLAYVLGFPDGAMRTGCVIGAGTLMISYAAIGGMRGTALIQILKTVILLGSGLVVAGLILHTFGWSPRTLFRAAAHGSGAEDDFLHYGLQFASGPHRGLDMVSTQCAIVLGGACLPHVTMRMYTAGSAPQVRRAMSWAISTVTLFIAVITVIGVGATALIGRAGVAGADARGNTAYLLGSRAAFGMHLSRPESLLFATVTTAIFLTLLASVASMTLACANSLAHDIAAARPNVSPLREMALARVAALAVGLPVIALAVLAQHRSLQPLATVSFCLGASAIAPALVYSLFWRRFTRAGLLCTLIGGTVSVLVLMTGTNLVSGSPGSAFPEADFNWFPSPPPRSSRCRRASCAVCSAPSCPAGRRSPANANAMRPSNPSSSPARPAPSGGEPAHRPDTVRAWPAGPRNGLGRPSRGEHGGRPERRGHGRAKRGRAQPEPDCRASSATCLPDARA